MNWLAKNLGVILTLLIAALAAMIAVSGDAAVANLKTYLPGLDISPRTVLIVAIAVGLIGVALVAFRYLRPAYQRWATPPPYLPQFAAELSVAIRAMVLESRWGIAYCRRSRIDAQPTLEAMNAAVSVVTAKAAGGALKIRRRPAGGIATFEIPAHKWRIASLAVTADAGTWRLEIVPRPGVQRAKIADLLGYDRLTINREEFETLWPGPRRPT
jgi:hypothetical protein